MSNRTIFALMMAAIFVTVLSVGLTLLFKDQTDKALEVLSGGAFVAVFIMIMGGGVLLGDD